MSWTAKIDQQQNALMLTFFMFVAMTLVVIRTGLISRGLSASFPCAPAQNDLAGYPLTTANNDAPLGHGPPSSDLSHELDHLYAITLALLHAAALIARQVAGLERAIYELMKLADALAKSLHGDFALRSWRGPPRKRLDAP